MKKQSSIMGLILILAVWFGMAFECGGNNGGGGTTRTSDGFETGHRLKGRYSNSDQGIQSFTFYTAGKFERGGASAGSYRGGEYSSGSTRSGTYELRGNTLSLEYTDGTSEDLTIEILNNPDYSLESPVRLRINGRSYTNVD